MCGIFAPAGDEYLMSRFILDYVEKNKRNWKVQPEVIAGSHLQDCIILVFGDKPQTAAIAHMDSIGFMVRYERELIKVGGPRAKEGYRLVGSDSKGEVTCEIHLEDIKPKRGEAKRCETPQKKIVYKADREIERGTNLVFECDFREDEEYVQSCYLDNRLGCWNLLKLAETLEEGILIFSTYEEVGGGAMPFILDYLKHNYLIRKVLISDITWVTEGVKHGKGVAISVRDSFIPRRRFVKRIVEELEKTDIPFQIEVESSGGSDGKEVQFSPFAIDWCFIGAPEDNVHTPDEKVHKKDILAMLRAYQYLMKVL
ncbi:MAG: M20/M25/M40 family metallo-hydrolase [Bernardetiaceae bacterium]|nr:M20/M25/M40 family metallo-hydrolase [Bernardetiaceae bacterium]